MVGRIESDAAQTTSIGEHGAEPFDFGGKSWQQWQEAGNDQGSIVADPLFVNAEKRDFRLRPGSPAKEIGFRPFDFSKAGVYGDAKWMQLARPPTFPEPYVVPKPEPLSLRDGFERENARLCSNWPT